MNNTPVELNKSVSEFSEVMFERLVDNAHKSHWSTDYNNFLFEELVKRVLDLNVMSKYALECSEEDLNKIVNKCADIANFSMMLADNYKNRRGGK